MTKDDIEAPEALLDRNGVLPAPVPEHVSLKQLAAEMGVDRSLARKVVISLAKRLNIHPRKRITPDSRNQPALVLTRDEADRILEYRNSRGYVRQSADLAEDLSRAAEGAFYAIQLVPDLKEGRLKLGFAADVSIRLSQHRTSAPTARLCRVWGCKRVWEQAAIDSATRTGCTRVGIEVFDFDEISLAIANLDQFFSVMPLADFAVPYSGVLTQDEEEAASLAADDDEEG